MGLSGLYLVIDVSLEGVFERVTQALEGGVDILQLWGIQNAQDSVKLGDELMKLAQRQTVPLLVQDDVELAQKLGADGVHLDRQDLTPKDVRRRFGAKALVGVTCSTNFDRVLWAAEHGADYISFCSLFPSPSVSVCDLVPLELVARAKDTVKIPIFAAGGITLENAPQVLEAGADGLAVSSAVLRAPDPKETARSFKALLARYGKGVSHRVF
jgi:thiamine-phosphate pyrophosphorylase